MTEMLLAFMLGPFRIIGDFYFENQTILNTIVVGIALYKLMGKRKRTQDESA